MCGIAGWVGRPANPRQVASDLLSSLHHRGPDGRDFRLWDDAGLVHTRLKIIDLSENGRQPMSNEDGSIWVTFNGEIYNHRELQCELKSRGHMFRSHCDAEVIPHLYEELGSACVSRFFGMFSIAVLDLRRRRLVLARDRFGIKPMFYARGTSEGAPFLAFASEIRALTAVPGVDRSPNPQAVSDFVALTYVPGPQTFYSGITALEPGESLTVDFSDDGQTANIERYHQWSGVPDLSLDQSAAADAAEGLLRAAVESQVESEVPLGSLLSGGIDSSLVSAFAQPAVNEQLRTFSVRFADPTYDETVAAAAVSKHIGSQHLTLDMHAELGWEYACDLLLQPGQPHADTSIFGVHSVARLTRQYVTVALSGDGGDEGFGGYMGFSYIERLVGAKRIPRWGLWAGGHAAGAASTLGLMRPGFGEAATYFGKAGTDITDILAFLMTWIRPREHSQLVRPLGAQSVRRLFEPAWDRGDQPGASSLERLSARTTEAYTRLYLAYGFLPKVDIASMKESLEVRVPMLDEKLFALGLRLPHYLKHRAPRGKLVLREVAARHLPEDVAKKPKGGFGVPIHSLMDQQFKQNFKETLLDSSSRLPEFLVREQYEPIVQAFSRDTGVHGIKQQGMNERALILLGLHLHLEAAAKPRPAHSAVVELSHGDPVHA